MFIQYNRRCRRKQYIYFVWTDSQMIVKTDEIETLNVEITELRSAHRYTLATMEQKFLDLSGVLTREQARAQGIYCAAVSYHGCCRVVGSSMC